jgi:hypothetical protein
MTPPPPVSIRWRKFSAPLVKSSVGSPAWRPASLYLTRNPTRSVLPLLPPGFSNATTRAPGTSRHSTAVSHSVVTLEPEIGTSSAVRGTGGLIFSATA